MVAREIMKPAGLVMLDSLILELDYLNVKLNTYKPTSMTSTHLKLLYNMFA